MAERIITLNPAEQEGQNAASAGFRVVGARISRLWSATHLIEISEKGTMAYTDAQYWQDLKQGFRRLLVLGFIAMACVLLWRFWLMPEKERLAHEYHVSQAKVFIEPKPHGCDFDDAPLGNKHCH